MNNLRTSNKLPTPILRSHYPEGIGETDVSDPSKPLEVLIGPIHLISRDRIDLYWGDNTEIIDSYTHSPDAPDTNGIFSLYVDTRWIQPGTPAVRYTYTPFPGGIAEHSPSTTVTVKLSIPGGRDPDPATPYENEKLQLPIINPPGVITSPEGVSVTVQPYENMTEGDVLSVYWHGIEIPVPALQADQTGRAVVVDIPRDIVIEAGDSENIVVRYDLRDVVSNWSRFSFPAYVEVEAGNSTLPAPIAPQAPNRELDLEKLSGADVQTLVLSHPDIVIGDTINFIVERNTAEGLALEPYTVSKVVSLPGSFVEFLIPNAQFQPIAQGRTRFKYSVSKVSGQPLRSKSLALTVLGKAQELAPPIVPVAANGLLDPTLHNVQVQVPDYYFMADGHDVTLVWMGKTANGANVMHEEVKNLHHDDVGKTLQFLIPDDKVIALAGGTLEVHYTITTFAKDFFKSPVLHLLVETDSNAPLPAPLVDNVNEDGVLDPGNVVLEAVVRVLPYSAMSMGDKVTVRWDASTAQGTYSTYTVINSGTVNKEVIFRVPRSFVVASLNGTVEVWYDVQRGGRTWSSIKQRISIRESTLPTLPLPRVSEAQGNVLDPAHAIAGATVVVEASAQLRAGDRVTVQWQGPKGSESQETTISGADAGQSLKQVFAYALVIANAGQAVAISYTVNRTNGQVQTSDTLHLNIRQGLGSLPAPSMDTVGADGVVMPSKIPETGATVRVRYTGMSGEDSVIVSWRGASGYNTSAQTVGNSTELLFKVPKALIAASSGRSATVIYTVVRAGKAVESAPLWLSVYQGLILDTTPVTLSGKVYLLPGSPDLLPSLPADTSVQRVARGGQAPYSYTSSNTLVAKVDGNGLVTVRGKGTTSIRVSDSRGESISYNVSVTGVIHCLSLGSGSFTSASNAAASQGARLCSLNELREIHAAYGNRWPLGNANFWSSTVAMSNVVGWKWYYVKNLVSGGEFKLLHHNASLGVAIR